MVATAAVLSDIHGVLPALDAVLAEPEVAAAERIVLTGDIAAGPQPTLVLDRLLSLGERAIWVRGNADRELADLAQGKDIPVPDEISPWAARQLSSAHVSLLGGLPHPVTCEVDGFGRVLFCHGSPRDDAEVVLVDTRLERWAQVLAGVPAEVTTVVCGHTHMQFMRQAHGRQIVNPGSVGMPYGRAGAHWALLSGGAVTLRRSEFDAAAACTEIAEQSAFPGAAAWADFFIHARASDADAMAAFGPRDGRGATAAAGS